MAKKLTAFLHENGLLIMLDVTTKDEHSGYFYPQLMNNAINDYVRKSRTIETLLPLSVLVMMDVETFALCSKHST